MKRFRWGLALALVAVLVCSAGCEGFKIVRRGEYERLRGIERLNKDQAALITALTHDNERLTDEVAALKAQLGTTQKLADSIKAEADRLRQDLDAMPKTPEFPELGDAVTSGTVPEGTYLQMGSDLLFDSGKATLKSSGKAVLDKIVSVLKQRPNEIRVCGYTDSQPIRHSKWASNFELSGARALSVLNHLDKSGIAAERLHFSGYGQYDLMYDANGSENKDKSRRVRIVLLHEWVGKGSKRHKAAAVPK